VVVGTKSGEIMLYDLSASTLIETFAAHSGAVWSLDVRPDGKGLVSGSADKDVKFWEFEVRDVGGDEDDTVSFCYSSERLTRESNIFT
jgi:U3 small nucleolar RNA-associated protein 12